jgi:hypothetical protein
LKTLVNRPDTFSGALAIIPAYREAKTIESVVAGIRRQGIEPLVIDDCSGDGTADRAESAGARVIRLPLNLGYGSALQTGYLFALRNGYDAVVQLDADGQHAPEFALDLLRPVLEGETDVAIGSRFLDNKSYPVPSARRIGQKFFGWLVRLFTGLEITDPTSGYQALSRRVISYYCGPCFPADYPDANMIILLNRMGFAIREIPVRMGPPNGKSMHSGVARPIYYMCEMLLSVFISILRVSNAGSGKEER